MEEKTTTSSFDVIVGSHDNADVWELVSTFILSKLESITDKKYGFYRDDKLVFLRNMNAQQTDNM